MALTHLADTSVLTRMKISSVRKAVQDLVSKRRLGRCTMTDLEMGFSARNATEWDTIHSAVALFPQCDLEATDVVRACAVQRALAERGLKGRKVPDLLIGAAAERQGLIMLHYDRDFQRISEITGQPHEWVVPTGSVD